MTCRSAASARPRRPRPKTAFPEAAATCPVERAIWIIGGRWKLLVIRALMLGGPQRYNDILRAIPQLSAKELTRNLRELETAGLVVRQAADPPDRPTYGLTDLGAGLHPAFKLLGEFGQQLARPRAVAAEGEGG
ncbi:winged helix-turn-helix transcriptional regulator [Caulobacter sp. LARHSG274]